MKPSRDEPIKKQVYLVPIQHEFQWNERLSGTNDLSSKLNELVNKFPIDFVGEEFSTEALNSPEDSTIPQKIAKQFNIRHSLCDPNTTTRKKIGYPTQSELRSRFGIKSAIVGTKEYETRKNYEKKFYYIREKYWLDQINKVSVKNIIFICGNEHTENFTALLIKNGYHVSVTTFV